ncbi:alpha-crystallin domain-containing protein [Belnapia moabensis]|nr:hypothetical protein [Belnapia moabensis]
MLEEVPGALQAKPIKSYPPHEIERTGENACRVTLAVAGLRPDA